MGAVGTAPNLAETDTTGVSADNMVAGANTAIVAAASVPDVDTKRLDAPTHCMQSRPL